MVQEKSKTAIFMFQSSTFGSMPKPLTHDQCRIEMCCACGGRAGKRNITAAFGERIRKWAQPSWNPEVLSHPVGICESCRIGLLACERDQTISPKDRPGLKEKWDRLKLEDISVPRGQEADSCSCPICRARKLGAGTGRRGIGTSEAAKHFDIPKIIEKNITETPNKTNVEMSCPKCFQQKIGRGIPHKCTDANKKQNKADLVKQQEGKEQILS